MNECDVVHAVSTLAGVIFFFGGLIFMALWMK